MTKLAIYSIRVRFLFSMAGNLGRGALTFVTNLLIARFLLPHDYGELSFLLTSFLAITQFFDQGVTAAFYTFITRDRTRPADYLLYTMWILFQLLLLVLFIKYFASNQLIQGIWNHNSRELIVLAFLALFARQVIGTTAVQVGEAQRKTLIVQFASIVCALAYLAIVMCFQYWFGLSIRTVFIIMIVVYSTTAFILLAYFINWRQCINILFLSKKLTFSESAKEYYHYCKPLLFLAIVTFFYTFLDNWMLNHFAGAVQQGYYQVASQFTTISLLAATAIMRVFWKELSVLHAAKDSSDRMQQLFGKVFRIVLFCGAVSSGFLIPWVKDIIYLMLGTAYLPGYIILAIMFLYPIHQSVGQILGAVYSATSKTAVYTWVSIPFMILAIPASYFLLAPRSGMWLPGLHLGGLGLALKMVVINILSVNFMQYVLCRLNGWKYDWLPQFVCVAFMLCLGYLVRGAFLIVSPGISNNTLTYIFVRLLLAGLLYGLFVLGFLFWKTEWFLGFDRARLLSLLNLKGS